MNTPCLNCKDRNMNCHSQCNKYKQYRDKLDKAKINKQDIEFNDYLYDAIDRMQSVRVAK